MLGLLPLRGTGPCVVGMKPGFLHAEHMLRPLSSVPAPVFPIFGVGGTPDCAQGSVPVGLGTVWDAGMEPG